MFYDIHTRLDALEKAGIPDHQPNLPRNVYHLHSISEGAVTTGGSGEFNATTGGVI